MAEWLVTETITRLYRVIADDEDDAVDGVLQHPEPTAIHEGRYFTTEPYEKKLVVKRILKNTP